MFIEFKEEKKHSPYKCFFTFYGFGHMMINSKGNIQRVESVLNTDKSLRDKFGKS